MMNFSLSSFLNYVSAENRRSVSRQMRRKLGRRGEDRRQSTLRDYSLLNGFEALEDRVLLSGIPALVTDINTAGVGSDIDDATAVGRMLFFTADDAVHGRELWKSDGTPAGTVLVKDIKAGSDGSDPHYLTNVNGILFFSADNGGKGRELWKSDGTAAGTVLVKNINAGSDSSDPFGLTNVNGTLFFSAENGSKGRELWKSDGTVAGTMLVKDIKAGSDSSGPFHLANVRGTLFFTANDGSSGYELWKSDGTATGTALVKDINAGLPSSTPSYLTKFKGRLFFAAYNSSNGTELWKSDGTAAGTVLVKDIAPGSADSSLFNLTRAGDTLFFSADDGSHGLELWKSNGTTAGTMLVRNINPGSSYGYADSSFPSYLTNVNGTLFFSADNGTKGHELWKSDGTAAGTVLVRNINPDSSYGFAYSSAPTYLTNVNGTLFFSANDGSRGRELWESDGTKAGTVLVKNIRSESLDGYGDGSYPANLASVRRLLFFSADNGSQGSELWQSDGTAAGTRLVKDINLASSNAYPSDITNVDGTLFFTAINGSQGRELWKSDGTAAGTVLVKDINPGVSGSDPRHLTDVNGTLFFTADNGSQGRELWKSDGTAAGTVLVRDIYPGSTFYGYPQSSYPSNLTNFNGTLFFSATDESKGRELWKSDGTAAGTVRVKDINAGSDSAGPFNLANVNGALFFTADDGSHGFELWKSDSTAAGTVLVKDINPGLSGSIPSYFTEFKGKLFFSAYDGSHGVELWKSDGTAARTRLVHDINPGSADSSPHDLIAVGGTLFFGADDGSHGLELWKSDGTAAGTKLVKDIRLGSAYGSPASSFPSFLTNLNGTLLFTADNGSKGHELWKSDGTAAGTVLVKDIAPGPASSSPYNLTNVGGTLFFDLSDGGDGVELWQSDGIVSGTVLVNSFDHMPYSYHYGSVPPQIGDVNGTLFFTGYERLTGVELYTLLPKVTLSTDRTRIDEAGGTAQMTATLSSPFTQDVTVKLRFSGRARNIADYSRSATKIVIPAGNLSGSVTLTAKEDALVEGNEQIRVEITSVINGVEDGLQRQIVAIKDNDRARLVIQPTRRIGERAGAQPVFVTLRTLDGHGGTARLAPGVRLRAEVVDLGTGTAKSGLDYLTFGTQLVRFGPGSGDGARRRVLLTPIDDALLEGNETVKLRLRNLNQTLNGQASLGNPRNTTTIVDNDLELWSPFS